MIRHVRTRVGRLGMEIDKMILKRPQGPSIKSAGSSPDIRLAY